MYLLLQNARGNVAGSTDRERAAVTRLLPILVFAGLIFCRPGAYAAVETVVVTASPLSAGAMDPDKIPGAVESLSLGNLDREADGLPGLVASQMPEVSLNDEQGSPFQPDFVYRGFEASPISGVAEGLAVYQNGVRLNEAFGDSVNWDLVPEFAVNRLTVESDNPVFGLNALGGAVSLQMKDGFQVHGTQAELSGGSFGNISGNAQYGAQWGRIGLYAGIGALHDDGFRNQSPTALRQGYADIGYEDAKASVHLSLGGALNDIDAVGPTPVQLLAQDRRAVFTYPQAMRNEMELAQLHGSYALGDAWRLSASVYGRHFAQHLIDGNTTDVVACANDPAQFCLEGAGDFPGDALYDANGDPVAVSALPAGATPGEIDRTRTDTESYGAAFEASSSASLFGHGNSFIFGASLDRGDTDYMAQGELGTLQPNLRVAGAGIVIDQAGNPTAQPPLEEPVSVAATNAYGGLYAIDAFDITPAWTWTLSGRLNIADIRLRDRLGDSLNGHHAFSRIDPGTGFTYRLAPFATAYMGYSQSNRAPTAGELSCANPAAPCLLDAFLVSDPGLKQVVARNYEAGLRGKMPAGAGAMDWSLGAWRTEVARDILLLATDVNGFGYFQNAGTTRHQGVDAKLGYRTDRWHVQFAYSLLDATFRNALVLSSDSPAANAGGLIFVRPGDRLPLMPRNRATLSGEYAVSAAWKIGADLRYQSGMYLAGDQSNQEPQLPGYATIGLHTSYRIAGGLELFGEIDNLLDRRYDTYGTFTELDGLPPNFHLTDPRSVSPAMGRAFYGGVRVVL
jgi:iron complex outermembrane recepter protein